VLPFVPPAKPKMSSLLTGARPAEHFAPRDPVQQTTGVRQDPPDVHKVAVADDPSLPAGMNPLDWQPFSNVLK
jgi:hypothetical protein